MKQLTPLQQEVYDECCDEPGMDLEELQENCSRMNAVECRQTLKAWRGSE